MTDQLVRQQGKSPFDDDGVVANLDVQEAMFDYTLHKLNADGERGVLITEPLGNPPYFRRQVNELLFEGYNVTDVTIGVDALWAYGYGGTGTGMVLSAGRTSAVLVPFLRGRPLLNLSKRLNWGGSQASEYLVKLMQLKYPSFPTKLTLLQAEGMIPAHCYISQNYEQEISTYLEKDTLAEKDRIIQFPYQEYIQNVKTEEELARQTERKREAGRRLQELASVKRAEKMAENESAVEYYRKLRQLSTTEDNDIYMARILKDGFQDTAELEKEIKRLEVAIRRTKRQDEQEGGQPEQPSFPLINVPDDDLDPEGMRQKRHQKLLKANWEARKRLKEEKRLNKERAEEEARADEEKRAHRLDEWLEEKHELRMV